MSEVTAAAGAGSPEERHGKGLFQAGDFRLASGVRSPWKIDCDALVPADWTTLALMLRDRLPPFGAVEGVPAGGLRLAEALAPYATTGPLLVVDDVWTTGGSWERWRAGREAVGAVVFARGPVPPHITALFYMDCAAIRARGTAP
jgi:orotate phosphoribosyltransferase